MTDASLSVRARLGQALAGEPVSQPVFVVYDWFVKNRPWVDWPALCQRGLGQINHADLVSYRRPHLEIIETTTMVQGQPRRDVRWLTDIGELHEWYAGEWRQEYLIKEPGDYRIMQRAWLETAIEPRSDLFEQSEQAIGEGGMTVGQLDRTPFQKIQIDYAGLERFSYDVADRCPELMDLLELMNELKLQEFRAALSTPARQIKLWENLSIETMGPLWYQDYLVPMYEKIFDILAGTGRKLQVHYDGKLRIIADQVRRLPFDGIDSVTPVPEGDMTIAEARACWPEKFLWLHPTLTWYSLPLEALVANVIQMARDAGPSRYCLMISEEVPPGWQVTIPAILDALYNIKENEHE
jgi:hypothetical protein